MEHRHDVARDLGAKRVLGGLTGREPAGHDVARVFLEKAFLHHGAGRLLVDDHHVEVRPRGAALLLGLELFVDLL
jgi:hypothetical protein